jgi:hypothetical protein
MDIGDELAKILAEELREEFDRQYIQSMIDHMMPDREKYESFYHDHYNGLIKSEKLTDFSLLSYKDYYIIKIHHLSYN